MSGCTRYAINEENDKDVKLEPVIFTENAAKVVSSIIADSKKKSLHLRLQVISGGCSGLEYSFTLDEKIRDSDYTTITNGVTLAIDTRSYKYVSGATIDYVENIEGEHFTIDNPNASKTCGCGSSFDV